jgi:hypothetical protein
MPLLLEDLVEDTVANLNRTADRFEAAAKELAARQDASEELRHEVADFARRSTDYAIAALPQAEAIWKWGMDRLADRSLGAEAERLLQTLQTVFTLQARLCVIARTVWKQAEAQGTPPERLDELDRVRWRFERLAHHAKTGYEHSTKGWQPKDPERFAEAMRRLEEGKVKFLTAEEALARLRAKQGGSTEG